MPQPIYQSGVSKPRPGLYKKIGSFGGPGNTIGTNESPVISAWMDEEGNLYLEQGDSYSGPDHVVIASEDNEDLIFICGDRFSGADFNVNEKGELEVIVE